MLSNCLENKGQISVNGSITYLCIQNISSEVYFKTLSNQKLLSMLTSMYISKYKNLCIHLDKVAKRHTEGQELVFRWGNYKFFPNNLASKTKTINFNKSGKKQIQFSLCKYQDLLIFFISRAWQTFLNEADSKYFRLCALCNAPAVKDNKQMNGHGCVPKNFI